jgi:hypothetical protein
VPALGVLLTLAIVLRLPLLVIVALGLFTLVCAVLVVLLIVGETGHLRALVMGATFFALLVGLGVGFLIPSHGTADSRAGSKRFATNLSAVLTPLRAAWIREVGLLGKADTAAERALISSKLSRKFKRATRDLRVPYLSLAELESSADIRACLWKLSVSYRELAASLGDPSGGAENLKRATARVRGAARELKIAERQLNRLGYGARSV